MAQTNSLPLIASVFGPVLLGAAVACSEDLYQRKLYENFDGGTFSETGGLYYRDNEEQRAGVAEFQSEIKRNGTGSIKLTVRPNCEEALVRCSERAEIWEHTRLRVPYDRGVWYGFAVKFGAPHPVNDERYLIAQWKREIGPTAQGDFSPFLGFRYTGGNLSVTVETNHDSSGSTRALNGICPDGTSPVWLRPETRQMRVLAVAPPDWDPSSEYRYRYCTPKVTITDRGAKLPHPSKGWMHFAVYSQPDPDGSGHIEIFSDGEWIVTVRGAIGHADEGLGKNQYFKFGPYRDGTSENWVMYYDDFVRSSRCEDVLGDAEKCSRVHALTGPKSPLSASEQKRCSDAPEARCTISSDTHDKSTANLESPESPKFSGPETASD